MLCFREYLSYRTGADEARSSAHADSARVRDTRPCVLCSGARRGRRSTCNYRYAVETRRFARSLRAIAERAGPDVSRGTMYHRGPERARKVRYPHFRSRIDTAPLDPKKIAVTEMLAPAQGCHSRPNRAPPIHARPVSSASARDRTTVYTSSNTLSTSHTHFSRDTHGSVHSSPRAAS